MLYIYFRLPWNTARTLEWNFALKMRIKFIRNLQDEGKDKHLDILQSNERLSGMKEKSVSNMIKVQHILEIKLNGNNTSKTINTGSFTYEILCAFPDLLGTRDARTKPTHKEAEGRAPKTFPEGSGDALFCRRRRAFLCRTRRHIQFLDHKAMERKAGNDY